MAATTSEDGRVCPVMELPRRVLDSFWSQVDVGGPDDCWRFRQATHYGLVPYTRPNGQHSNALAHRVAWFLTFGSLPPAPLLLDHLCKHKWCVNARHLEPVTNRENVLRGDGPSAINARKTECANGHALVGSNVRLSQGKRVCRLCRRAIDARHRAKRQAAA